MPAGAADIDITSALAITPSSSARERTVDITTTGAITGRPRRIEVWFLVAPLSQWMAGSPPIHVTFPEGIQS